MREMHDQTTLKKNTYISRNTGDERQNIKKEGKERNS